jgi:hypothetical protein
VENNPKHCSREDHIMVASRARKSSPKKPEAPSKAAAAFEQIEPEFVKVEPHELVQININIPTAVSIALGALPNVTPLRPSIVKDLPNHPVRLLDKLESYALAAWYAHLLTLPAGSPSNPIRPLLDEAIDLRAALLSDADALARRNLLDPEVVQDIRAGQGNVDIANDLVALSAVFTMRWAAIEGKTAATPEEIKRAGDLGPMLLAALGVREIGSEPVPVGDAADQRMRAFALFVRAYDSVRRAVAYLRWEEGDAEAIAPSLYRGRGGRSGGARQEEPSGEAPGGEAPGESAPGGSAPGGGAGPSEGGFDGG